MKECVVILGMHRSGTSVLSGLVSAQGFYLGPDEMPVREDNPKGFFENMKVYRLNQSILEAFNTSWDNHFFTCEQIPPSDLYDFELKAKAIIKEEFSLVKKIFIKDPRMCLLFPLWEKVLLDMGYNIKVILAYRSPMEVAQSLRSRNDMDIEKSLMLWSHYFFQAEKTSRSYNRLVVRYNDDFEDLDAFFDLLAKFLEVSITPEMRLAAHDLYTPSLKHHQLMLDNFSAEVPSYLKNFISILQAKKLDQSENLDEIIDDFYFSKQFFLHNENNLKQTNNNLNSELAKIQNQLQDLEKSNASSQAELKEAEKNLLKAKKDSQKRMLDLRASAEKRFASALEDAHHKLLSSENEYQQRLDSLREELQNTQLSSKGQFEKLREESEEKELRAKQKLLQAQEEFEEKELRAKQKLLQAKEELEEERLYQEQLTAEQLKNAKQEAEEELLQVKVSSAERLEQAKKAASNLQIELEQTKLQAQESTTENLEKERAAFHKKLQKATTELGLKSKENKELQNKKASLQSQYDSLQRRHEQFQRDIKLQDQKLSISQEIFNKVCTDQGFQKQIVRTFTPGGYPPKRWFNPFAKKKNNKSFKEKAIISSSGLFSPFYYLTNYPDVWKNNVNPLNHYCNEGWREGRNPGPQFNTRDYLSLYDDVAGAGINPLVHYIQHGMKEGRHAFVNKSQSKTSESSSSKPKASDTTKALQKLKQNYSGKIRAEIDYFDEGKVSGWFLSAGDSLPLLKINDLPAKCIEFDSPEQETNFSFQSISSITGEAKVELLALSEEGVKTVSKKTFNESAYVLDKYSDIEKAYQICKDHQSVAITVWEGAHNPIGRAKVLYDVINTKRPVVIFAYVFGSFGKDLWAPLKASGLNIVLIPFEERMTYQRYMQDRGVKFNTVWICKHRLHSFELASMISRPETACILDMDDNEDVFVSSKGSELKPYGIFSKNKSNYFLEKVSVRSVASISLQENYGGMLMRHARKKHVSTKPNNKPNETITAVFIGTIRPHKNIAELVAAVTRFNDTSGIKLKLAIGGDFNPPSMRETLDTPHTIILDDVSNDNLFDTLSQYDVLITGFPDEKAENKDINKYQITSKIGDGFATGKPVLTPYSPAVEDLQNTPGLFVFTPNNFTQKLKQALEYKKQISLPDEFTLEHSYTTFSKLEKLAKKESQAQSIFTLEPFYQCLNSPSIGRKNIVLVWKQYDAGIYGRRIDIVARYYKQRNPESNVTVIEAVSEWQLTQLMESHLQFDNSTLITNETLSMKLYQYSDEGVNYRLISHNRETTGWNSFEEKFKSLLNAEDIYPHNSVMILFPLHQVFERLISTLKTYKLIVDLVDNQIKWITTPEGRLKGLKQYYELISIADEVVANSPQNIAFFEDLNFFTKKSTPHFISNWYTLPKAIDFKRETKGTDAINLVYSGNLNDRIDWELFESICKALAPHNGKLHIAGSTIRRPEEMKGLLEQPNCVYHGVVNEKQLLRLLQHMDFAVIPHVEDKISKFMDPIKLKMYKKLGLTSLSTKLPGLPKNDPAIVIADSPSDFLSKLEEMLINRKELPVCDLALDDVGEKYSALIDQLSSC